MSSHHVFATWHVPRNLGIHSTTPRAVEILSGYTKWKPADTLLVADLGRDDNPQYIVYLHELSDIHEGWDQGYSNE